MSASQSTHLLSNGDVWDVIIVGAGVAGVSAAYHLCMSEANVLERKSMLILDAGPKAGEGVAPRRRSGSATMKDVAGCVKMMVQVYAGSSSDMIRHHGRQGAAEYLKATKRGLEIQKAIAKEIWKDADYQHHMKELGSYYVGYSLDQAELSDEFHTLKSLGCDDIEWCDRQRLTTVSGLQRTNFDCAIYFPKDAIIDSSMYAKTLLQHVLEQCQEKAEFRSSCIVHSIHENQTADVAEVKLSSGEILRSRKVVVATGALFQEPNTNGLIKPCYSYLVHVPIPTQHTDDDCEFSPNFFTWGFSHDWCFTNGKVRVSGEDHFSAYKSPRLTERCTRLSEWTLQQYQCSTENSDVTTFPHQYGLYSETPDMVPLVGTIRDESQICYLLGCNAWGQTILSSCASLIPGILGFATLDDQQQQLLELVTIQRFEELPDRHHK